MKKQYKNNRKNPQCPVCEAINSIKFGFNKNKQRYRCKECGHTFYAPEDTDYKYTRHTKQVLSLLFNILENDFFGNEDLEKALHPTNEYYKIAQKVQFNTKYVKECKNKKDIEIGCYKAKLLICQDDKNITFIQIPSYVPQKNNKHNRIITIRDNYDAGCGYSFQKHNKPLIKKIKQQGNN